MTKQPGQRVQIYLPADLVARFQQIQRYERSAEVAKALRAWWGMDEPDAERRPKKGTEMHNCHYVGPVADGSPVCHKPATKMITAVSDTQGRRLQAYVCDDHAEAEKTYFERIGHKQVEIKPIV